MNLHAVDDKGIVDPSITKYVGFSLIVGFTSMLLVDQLFLILKEQQHKKVLKNRQNQVEMHNAQGVSSKNLHGHHKENLKEPLLSNNNDIENIHPI